MVLGRKIIAVVVTYNPDNGFVARINKLGQLVDKVIVVDNGSGHDTVTMLSKLPHEVATYQLGQNMGIAYALNFGIDKALQCGCDWILTLDHDSTVTDDMLVNMFRTYDMLGDEEKNKVAMIVPGHIEEGDDYSYIPKDGVNSIFAEYALTEITSGSLVKSDYYKKFKYDERLFIDLVDHDFCLRLNSVGYKILKAKSAILVHRLGDSHPIKLFGKTLAIPTNHSPIRRYYMSRNRHYIWQKYGKDFRTWVLRDKVKSLNEKVKILLFENNKVEKLNMIRLGKKDFKAGKWSAYK